MQSLDGPTRFHKVMCQVIKQLGMGRRLTELAEVSRRAHDAFAKMLLPDAVYHDSRGQRILRIGDPLSQLQAAAALCDGSLVIAGDDAREMPRHQLAQAVVPATDMDADVMNPHLRTQRTAAFLSAIHKGNGRKGNLLQGIELGGELRKRRSFFGRQIARTLCPVRPTL